MKYEIDWKVWLILSASLYTSFKDLTYNYLLLRSERVKGYYRVLYDGSIAKGHIVYRTFGLVPIIVSGMLSLCQNISIRMGLGKIFPALTSFKGIVWWVCLTYN